MLLLCPRFALSSGKTPYRPLPGGTAKIDCRRSIEGERGKKKKRRRRRKKNRMHTSFPCAVLTHASRVLFRSCRSSSSKSSHKSEVSLINSSLCHVVVDIVLQAVLFFSVKIRLQSIKGRIRHGEVYIIGIISKFTVFITKYGLCTTCFITMNEKFQRHSSNKAYDFHKYMMRALEDDFKKVVGIR
ncbi:hypothetical protein BHM03_00036429 [Ensete ventricosum]|nr:hypothetical protein BHM03_00036429 [Ensete ventricosum]